MKSFVVALAPLFVANVVFFAALSALQKFQPLSNPLVQLGVALAISLVAVAIVAYKGFKWAKNQQSA